MATEKQTEICELPDKLLELPLELLFYLYDFFPVETLLNIKNTNRENYDLAISTLFDRYPTADAVRNLVLGSIISSNIEGKESYFIGHLKDKDKKEKLKWLNRFERFVESVDYASDFKFNVMQVAGFLLEGDENTREEIINYNNIREEIAHIPGWNRESFYLFPSFMRGFSKEEIIEIIFSYYESQSRPLSLVLQILSENFKLHEWEEVIERCLEGLESQTLTDFDIARNILNDIILLIHDESIINKLMNYLIKMLEAENIRAYYYADISNILTKRASRLSPEQRKVMADQLIKNIQSSPHLDALHNDSCFALGNIILAFTLDEFKNFIEQYGDIKKIYFQFIIFNSILKLSEQQFDYLFDFFLKNIHSKAGGSCILGSEVNQFTAFASRLSSTQFNQLSNEIIRMLDDVNLIKTQLSRVYRSLKTMAARLAPQQAKKIWERVKKISPSTSYEEYSWASMVLIRCMSKLSSDQSHELFSSAVEMLNDADVTVIHFGLLILSDFLSNLSQEEFRELKMNDFLGKIERVSERYEELMNSQLIIEVWAKFAMRLNAPQSEIDKIFEVIMHALQGHALAKKDIIEIVMALSPRLLKHHFERLSPLFASKEFPKEYLITLLPRLEKLDLDIEIPFEDSEFVLEYTTAVYRASKKYGSFFADAPKHLLHQIEQSPRTSSPRISNEGA